jgi:enoyl-CoA hydratase/carnithine racemase
MPLVTVSVSPLGVATLTLNDPSNLNAMSEEMSSEFSACIEQLRQQTTLRAVILTGAGKAFSAGGHLEMLKQKQTLTGEKNRELMHRFYNSFLGILSLKVPLVAAINGAAIGAGLCLACACDIRIASCTSKLGFTFLKLGLHPGMGATYLVPRLVGNAVATELLLTARVIDAQEAFRIGLVSRCCDEEKLLSEAEKVCNEICACGPESSAQLLETMRSDLQKRLWQALEREALCQSINYGSAEFAEGLAALQEKRAPLFLSRR